MTRLRQALATALVLGAAWGGLEALFVLGRPWLQFWAEAGRPLPFDGASWAAVVLQGALRYAVVCVLPLVLLVPIAARLPGLARPAELVAPRLLVAMAVFTNLYWHSKTWWDWNWGQPWHSPARLALAAGWALLSLLLARLVVTSRSPLRLPSRRVVAVAAAVLLLGGGWARQAEGRLLETSGATPPAGAPNVLFVVVDALRHDRLGCAGLVRDPPVSPHVDALAAEGVLFERAYAQAPFTWTSFGSFLTGKYPREHGLIKMSPDQRLDPRRNRTVAEALSEAGWATGAFLTGTLSNNTGLLGGFDTYFETIVGHEPVNRHSKWSVVRSRLLLTVLWNKVRQALDDRLVNTEALAWITAHADRPFFALVHYYSTHTPYDPPAPFDTRYDADYDGPLHPFTQSQGVLLMKHLREEGPCLPALVAGGRCEHFDARADVEHVRALYDAGVALADDMLGDLLERLETLGVAERTLVVFTSDHGEELFDHGVFEHDWMFETNLRVPLVLRLPGRAHAGTRVPWPVELRDLPATILDVAGAGSLAEPGQPTPGRSLLPDAAGIDPGPDEHHVFAENVRYISVANDRYKLTQNRFVPASRRVFDLLACPGEHHPLPPREVAGRPEVAALVARFEAYDAAMPDVDEVPSFAVDPDLLQNLVAMGYVDGMPQGAIDDSGHVDVSALGDTLLLGSNETLEEDLYEREFRWPPPGETGCSCAR